MLCRIAKKINQSSLDRKKSSYNGRYYIQKIKPSKLDGTNEYKGLMQYLSKTGKNLVELIDFTDSYFNNIKKR